MLLLALASIVIPYLASRLVFQGSRMSAFFRFFSLTLRSTLNRSTANWPARPELASCDLVMPSSDCNLWYSASVKVRGGVLVAGTNAVLVGLAGVARFTTLISLGNRPLNLDKALKKFCSVLLLSSPAGNMRFLDRPRFSFSNCSNVRISWLLSFFSRLVSLPRARRFLRTSRFLRMISIRSSREYFF